MNFRKLFLSFCIISSSAIFAKDLLLEEALKSFSPIEKSAIDVAMHGPLIQLGRKLYLDPRLSINDKISCNSCHRLDAYGVDNEKTSLGHDGKRGGRNAPTVYNAALFLAQFWDGRAKDLEEQALGPILNPVEMGMPSSEAVVTKLKNIAEYNQSFKQAFPEEKDPLTFNNIGKAIAAFEKTLLTPTRFDDFLRGKTNALTKAEKQGLKTFMSVGCTTCHNGPAVGGAMFMKLGFAVEYPTKDMGRYEVTKDENDRHVFKVPTLRNVLKTGPYFHDGSIQKIDEVIKIMAKHQLNVSITPKQIKEIKTFLQTLVAKDLSRF